MSEWYILLWDKNNKKIEIIKLAGLNILDEYKKFISMENVNNYELSSNEKSQLDLILFRLFNRPLQITIVDSKKANDRIVILCCIKFIHEEVPNNIKVFHNKLLTVYDVAKFLGLSPTTIRELIYRGKISSVKIGGIDYVPLSEVYRFVGNTYKFVPLSIQEMTQIIKDKIADIIYVFGVPRELANTSHIKKGLPIIDITKNAVYIPIKTMEKIKRLLNIKSLKSVIKYTTSTISIDGKRIVVYKIMLSEFGDMKEWIKNRVIKDLEIEGLIS